jgi:hypothetical protein
LCDPSRRRTPFLRRDGYGRLRFRTHFLCLADGAWWFGARARGGCLAAIVRQSASLLVESAKLGIKGGLAFLEASGARVQGVNGLVQLLERFARGTCITAHAMSFEQCPGPERLDEFEDAGWEYLERRAGVFIELPGEGEPPALQGGCHDIGAAAAHACADEGDGRIATLAQQGECRGVDARLQRIDGVRLIHRSGTPLHESSHRGRCP